MSLQQSLINAKAYGFIVEMKEDDSVIVVSVYENNPSYSHQNNIIDSLRCNTLEEVESFIDSTVWMNKAI